MIMMMTIARLSLTLDFTDDAFWGDLGERFRYF